MSVEVRFETDDGVWIDGGLAVPHDARAAAIVCHPHPHYGGNRFAPPDVAEPIVSAWPHSELATIESADHFLGGHSELAASLATDWIDRQLPQRD